MDKIVVGKWNIIFILMLFAIWWFGKIDTWTYVAIMISTMRIKDN